MDLHEINDPFDLYDPNYEDINLALRGEPDLSDHSDEDSITGSVTTQTTAESLCLSLFCSTWGL